MTHQAKISASAARSGQLSAPERSTRIIEIGGADGAKNALTLTRAHHRVVTKQSTPGRYIVSIDGLTASTTHAWKLYHNGRAATVGAHSLIPAKNDRITWRYVRLINVLSRD